MGYTKNIAVIRTLKNGFSADGGQLSGLVKAERYGNSLKIEVSLINFAPLTEGKYVVAVSDGKRTVVLDGLNFEGLSEVDTSFGFTSLICFVRGEVLPIATAVCGAYKVAVSEIKAEIEKQEKVNSDKPSSATAFEKIKYEDEAIAKENYYEYEQADKDGGAVRKDKKKKEDGDTVLQNEEVKGAGGKTFGGLAGGNFYDRMKDEIEKVLSTYPEEEALCEIIERSRWVRIDYGEGKFYVFGVIEKDGCPAYICYGIPSDDEKNPPESLSGMSAYLPANGGGYWIMYQDAGTGASVKIENT